MTRRAMPVLLVTSALASLGSMQRSAGAAIRLEPCSIEGTDEPMLCGSYEVFEDREARSGRTITLNIAVLPAVSSSPRPDPIFYLAGGPGGAATARAASFRSSWMRTDRDVVMVDQRGTGGSNPLRCALRGGPDDAQGYLFTGFEDPELLRGCRGRLESGADLRMYTTPLAMADIDEVRSAMGYDTINLLGLSWGSRSALVYMRQHPGQVRRAILNGIAPPALTYPLYHARDSQRALDLILEECAGDASCAAAFPHLGREFQEILEGLGSSPVEVAIQHPDTGATVSSS
jgi:pimeloyl-ACP methyl ester carboxylesterase